MIGVIVATNRYTHNDMTQAYNAGRDAVMASWRHWYDQLPDSLKSQIDAHEVARREEVAA